MSNINYRFYVVLFSFLFSLITAMNAQQSPIIVPDAKLTLVSEQFSFTEGPAADSRGNVFFTDQPNNQIWKYSTNGELSLFMDDAGRANGLYLDQQDNLVAAADEKDELWSISPDKKVTVLVKGFEGHRLNGPNDLWVDPKGGIYFTDPYYQRDYWERKKPDMKEMRVYYLHPDRKNVSTVVDDFVKPNGIIGASDGKILYISDIGAQKIYSYTINKDGSLSNKKLFVEKVRCDGMTLDNRGNVYLAGNGVSVYDKTGKKIEHIPVPRKWTANVTFGGKNKQTLFITASTAVYTLKMNVHGVK